jgi:hypothetical protein
VPSKRGRGPGHGQRRKGVVVEQAIYGGYHGLSSRGLSGLEPHVVATPSPFRQQCRTRSGPPTKPCPPTTLARWIATPQARPHGTGSGPDLRNSNDLLLTYSDFGISTFPDSPVSGTVVTGTGDSTLSNSSMRCW